MATELPLAQVFTVEDNGANEEKLKLDMEAQAAAAKVDVAPLGAQEWELKTYLTNFTGKYLKKFEEKFWSGHAVLDAPPLDWRKYAVPRQRGVLPRGVKWGIAYTETNEGSQQWIVAFDTANKKAYAEAGPLGLINWDLVEAKLDLSKNKVEYVDKVSGGRATAEIEHDGITARGFFY